MAHRMQEERLEAERLYLPWLLWGRKSEEWLILTYDDRFL